MRIVDIAFGQESSNDLGTFFGVQSWVLPKKVAQDHQTLLQRLEIRPFYAVELVLDMLPINAVKTGVDKTEVVDQNLIWKGGEQSTRTTYRVSYLLAH